MFVYIYIFISIYAERCTCIEVKGPYQQTFRIRDHLHSEEGLSREDAFLEGTLLGFMASRKTEKDTLASDDPCPLED